MLFFLISFLPFLILLSKSIPVHPLPSWASEMTLLSLLFWKEFICFFAQRLKGWSLLSVLLCNTCSKMLSKRRTIARVENVEESNEMSVLDLPELALEVILGKLSPAGLHNMAGVCSSLRERCRGDHLWDRHMREKWGRIVGHSARKEWELFLAKRKDLPAGAAGRGKPKGLLGLLSCMTTLNWFKSRGDDGSRRANYVPDDSMMSWYLALESGKFWFPAQVYNREHGHVGFMLSCYDAELCYDCHTDTFHARYPPHGRRTVVIEEGVQWDRLRAPAVDTSPHELHISNCLDNLRPGDHIEIQWRRNKEFPYGWWYGIVGHLESCDENQYLCRCHDSETVVLEFNQYTVGSRWRRAEVSRKDHREEGNETDGFYGGIRKLHSKGEIDMWKRLWPTDALE